MVYLCLTPNVSFSTYEPPRCPPLSRKRCWKEKPMCHCCCPQVMQEGEPQNCSCPTLPGVAVLGARLIKGQQLWHTGGSFQHLQGLSLSGPMAAHICPQMIVGLSPGTVLGPMVLFVQFMVLYKWAKNIFHTLLCPGTRSALVGPWLIRHETYWPDFYSLSV